MKIQRTAHYPHPVDIVWTALTDARAIRQWWVDTDFAPEPGRAFFFQDTPTRGWDGRVDGTVLEADPPRRVLFRWRGGGIDTTVEYRLTPTDDGGTDFTVTHDGFQGVGGLILGTFLRSGWKGYLRRALPDVCAHIAAREIDAPFPRTKAEREAAKKH